MIYVVWIHQTIPPNLRYFLFWKEASLVKIVSGMLATLQKRCTGDKQNLRGPQDFFNSKREWILGSDYSQIPCSLRVYFTFMAPISEMVLEI